MEFPKIPGVKIRLAKLSDYEEVLNIDRAIYGKMDYIPGLYRIYNQDTRHLQFVAESDGKIVAYRGMKYLKNDETYAAYAGRTISEYQHRGINEMMNYYTLFYSFKHFHKGSSVRWNVNGFEIVKKLGAFALSSMKILASGNLNIYRYLSCESLKENIAELEKKTNISMIKNLSLTNCTGILESQKHLDNLLQYGRFMIVDFFSVSIEVKRENLIMLCKTYPTMLSFDSKTDLLNGISSLGLCPLVDSAYRFDIWYHGSSDIDVLKSHLLTQTKHVISLFKNYKHLRAMVNFPYEVDVNTISEFLRPCFGEPDTSTKKCSCESNVPHPAKPYIKHKL